MTNTPYGQGPSTPVNPGTGPDFVPVDPVVGTTDPAYDLNAPESLGSTSDFGGQVGSTSGGQSKTETAKAEAADVKDTTVDAAKNVAGTAKQEASNVASEAGQQAKNLLSNARSELSGQASTQTHRVGDALHGLAKELGGMASNSEQQGPVSDLAQQAAHRVGEFAHQLQNREPAELLDDVRAFARRRPVAFLLLCGLAGVAAGRLTRGAVAANTSLDSPSGSSSLSSVGTTPAVTSGPSYLAATPTTEVGGGYAAGAAPAAAGGYVGTQGSYTDAGYVDSGYTEGVATTTGYADPTYPTAADPVVDAPYRQDDR